MGDSQVSNDQIVQDALSQAGVLKLWLESKRAEEHISNASLHQLRLEYTTIIQQLIERNNTREAEQKDLLANIEAENRRLKVQVDGVNVLESSFLESRAVIIQLQENEERLIQELRKSRRETMEAKARYEALVTHTNHKLSEANAEVQRLNDTYSNELSTLKAKIARYESTTSALQSSVASKDKEIARLGANLESLLGGS